MSPSVPILSPPRASMANAFSLRTLKLPLVFVGLGLCLEPECPNQESSSLLQSRTVVVKSDFDGDDKAAASSGGPSCSVLKNQGSHFTVGIEVGTPPQRFDVVADTGSNSVIVSSCICQHAGDCSKEDRCFTGGKGQSTSFLISSTTNGDGKEVPPLLSMTFGSGKIEAAVATDIVRVAGTSARMSESLLLMIGRDLKISGPFEGILGLGLPRSNLSMASNHLTALAGLDASRTKEKNIPPHRGGFLEEAGIPRFSVCFNNHGQFDGVLRLSQPAAQAQLGAIGRAHWAVDFGGISVGEASIPSSFCSRESMPDGQQTPCAAIPDSGTTLIMGPKEQIATLFSELCARWPRCMQKVKSPGNHTELSLAFSEVLLDCGDWMNSTHGLDQELPHLHLHLAGADGSKRVLKLAGAGYVVETMQDQVHYVTEHLFGISMKLPELTGQKKRVCSPAFGAHAYETKLNGPVWILGLPLFYEYQVGYELKSQPPGISFTEEPCGSCNPDGQLKESKSLSLVAGTRQPRLQQGPSRLPSFDVNEPL